MHFYSKSIILLTVTVHMPFASAPYRRKTQAAQVYYPVQDYLEIKLIAKAQNKSLASWIRETTLKEVKRNKARRDKLSEMPVFDWPNAPRNLSEHIDDIVYGDPHHERP